MDINTNIVVNPLKRLAYSLLGLLVGDMILFLFLLLSTFLASALLLATHMGQPWRQIWAMLSIFALNAAFSAAFSLVGWLFVGLPIALFFSAHSLSRLSWPLRGLIGATLGPVALLAIFAVLGHGHISLATFTGTSFLWACSVLVSIVAFMVYVALLRPEQFVKHT